MRPRAVKCDWVADGDLASAPDGCVEREPPAEPSADVFQDGRIPRDRVGVHGRHRTATAQRVEFDDRVADVQLGSFPGGLVHPVDSGDQKIGAKSPNVTTECRHRTIGRHQQRQDVELVAGWRALEPGVLPRGGTNQFGRDGGIPRMAIDQHLSLGAQRPSQAQQLVLPPGGAHALGTADPDESVARDAEVSEGGSLDLLPRHGLDGVAPQLTEGERHGPTPPARARPPGSPRRCPRGCSGSW